MAFRPKNRDRIDIRIAESIGPARRFSDMEVVQCVCRNALPWRISFSRR